MSLLPPPPIQVPFVTRQGDLADVWRRWFVSLWARSGGNEATSLNVLEVHVNASDDDFAVNVATQREHVEREAIDQSYEAAPIAAPAQSLDWLHLAPGRESTAIESSYTPQRSESHAGWNDILTDISSGRGVGATAPTWTNLRDGIYANAFSAILLNEIWVNLHLTHDYQWGTKVWPHIHWTTAGTNTGVVRWGIEYTFANSYGSAAFPASTTIYLEQAASGTAYTHMLAEPAEANGVALTNAEPDGILMCRIFRDATHVNDTCTDPAFAMFADLHYQSDGYLTNERNRTFTKRRD